MARIFFGVDFQVYGRCQCTAASFGGLCRHVRAAAMVDEAIRSMRRAA